MHVACMLYVTYATNPPANQSTDQQQSVQRRTCTQSCFLTSP